MPLFKNEGHLNDNQAECLEIITGEITDNKYGNVQHISFHLVWSMLKVIAAIL